MLLWRCSLAGSQNNVDELLANDEDSVASLCVCEEFVDSWLAFWRFQNTCIAQQSLCQPVLAPGEAYPMCLCGGWLDSAIAAVARV